jgi:catechol 2,3-dioxygenase-like lactoylglutathione lyase family enzyme
VHLSLCTGLSADLTAKSGGGAFCHMTIRRMDHVGIVVDGLAAAIAFFVELGLELEGQAPVEGRWVDRVVGLDGVRVDVTMMRTPDGHGRLELTKFHTPTAVSAEPKNARANTLGIRRIGFASERRDASEVGRLRQKARRQQVAVTATHWYAQSHARHERRTESSGHRPASGAGGRGQDTVRPHQALLGQDTAASQKTVELESEVGGVWSARTGLTARWRLVPVPLEQGGPRACRRLRRPHHHHQPRRCRLGRFERNQGRSSPWRASKGDSKRFRAHPAAAHAGTELQRPPPDPDQIATACAARATVRAGRVAINLIHGQRCELRERWTQWHRQQRVRPADREPAMICKTRLWTLISPLAFVTESLSCHAADVPADTPASAARADASSAQTSIAGASPAPPDSSNPPVPAAETSYISNGPNYGNVGPNGTVNNYAPPPRRLVGLTVQPPYVDRLRATTVQALTITVHGTDPDAVQLGQDFWDVAIQLGWRPTSMPGTVVQPGDLGHGVAIASTAIRGDESDPLLGLPSGYTAGASHNQIDVWQR